MLSKFFVAVLAYAIGSEAVTLKNVGETGFMHPWENTLENEDHEIDLHAAISEDDAPEPDAYPGENIAIEKANEEMTRWHNTAPIKVRHLPTERYDNRDLWWAKNEDVR